jgi:hypothetical protein
MRVLTVAWAALLAVGCVLDAEVPNGKLTCHSTAECPAGFECQAMGAGSFCCKGACPVETVGQGPDAGPGGGAGGTSGAGGASGVGGNSGAGGTAGPSPDAATAPSDGARDAAAGTPDGPGAPADTAAPSPDAPIALDQACGMFGTAYCANLALCHDTRLRQTFGTQAVCQERMQLYCIRYLGPLPGSHWTSADHVACARAIGRASCDPPYVRSFDLPECSYRAGDRANGQPCQAADQCQSFRCTADRDYPACGICSPPANEGEKCNTSFECHQPAVSAPWLKVVCRGAVCVASRGLMESCDDAHPCDRPYFCGADHRCAPKRGQGEACTLTYDECDDFRDLYCQRALGSETGTCKLRNVVPPGTICRAGDTCPAGSCMLETCYDWPREGGTCDEFKGPPCLFPADCSNGRCRLVPVPASCP